MTQWLLQLEINKEALLEFREQLRVQLGGTKQLGWWHWLWTTSIRLKKPVPTIHFLFWVNDVWVFVHTSLGSFDLHVVTSGISASRMVEDEAPIPCGCFKRSRPRSDVPGLEKKCLDRSAELGSKESLQIFGKKRIGAAKINWRCYHNAILQDGNHLIFRDFLCPANLSTATCLQHAAIARHQMSRKTSEGNLMGQQFEMPASKCCSLLGNNTKQVAGGYFNYLWSMRSL